MDIRQWLLFLAQILCIAVGMVLICEGIRYAVMLYKRLRLLRRMRKLCKKREHRMDTSPKAIFSLFSRRAVPGVQTYVIHFFPCRRRKRLYVFNENGGYYTTSLVNPVLISGHPYTYAPR